MTCGLLLLLLDCVDEEEDFEGWAVEELEEGVDVEVDWEFAVLEGEELGGRLGGIDAVVLWCCEWGFMGVLEVGT